MNVFFRELKAHYKGLIGWSVAMILLVVSSMAKLGTISGNGQNASQLLNAFPKPVAVIFGINGFDLKTVMGYFGITFLYIALTATIHAAIMGSEVVAGEERDKTAEFLFPKPISRSNVITAKLAAGLVNVLVINVMAIIASIASVDFYAKTDVHTPIILTLLFGLLFMQLLFFSLGAFFGGLLKNPKLPVILSTSILMGTYIIWVIIDLNSNLDLLKYGTPFKYFDASAIINSGHLDPVYVALSVVLIVVMIGTAYFTYNRRDLEI